MPRHVPALPLALVAAVAALATACARAPNAGGPGGAPRTAYVSGRCPVPDDVRGYPVVVTSENGAADPAWLARWARAAALRWQVPSLRRSMHPAYRSVRTRIVPEVPRWSDDWVPAARHTAEMLVRVSEAGVLDRPEVVATSGDDRFDRTLTSFANDPLPASPPLPPPPPGSPDTVRLRVRFGHEPEPGVPAGVVRFARQQRPVRVMPGSLVVRGRAEEYALVKYDVDQFGRYVLGSYEALDATSNEIARAISEGLERARFSPAVGDCEPIALTVIQSFGRR